MKANQKILDNKLLIGRTEWCQLPHLNIPAIKTKVDTGAKTSTIHACNIKTGREQEVPFVYFDIHPIQRNNRLSVHCKAPIIDRRAIRSSNGLLENRYVIETLISIGDQKWTIELNLSDRSPMQYRMLLGREAMSGRILVNPSIACNQGRFTRTDLKKMYQF